MPGRGWTLRARLAALLLATLIPLSGVGISWIAYQVRYERERAESHLRAVAESVANHAGYRVTATHEMLAVLARLPAIQAQDRRETERLLLDLLAVSPHLENLAAFTPDGESFATAVPLAAPSRISVRDRAWFQAVLQTREPVTSGFLVGRITGKPIALLAHPVLDARGRVVGVVGAGFRLATLRQETAGLPSSPEVMRAIVDGEGLVLAHRDSDEAIGQPLEDRRGMIRAETSLPRTPWRVVVEMPESAVNARVQAELIELGVPALLILLVVTGIGFGIAQRTWRPLQRLAGAVRRIGLGEEQIQIPVEGGGEVAEVAEALRNTLARVTRRQQELTALLQASQAIASSLDLESVLHAIVREAAGMAGSHVLRLFLVEDDGQMLRCRVGAGLPLEAERDLAIPVGESFSGQVAATGAPLAVADCRNDPRLRYPEHVTKYSLVSYLGLPVKLGDRVLGVLVFNTEAARTYTSDEIAYLSAFAAQAAIAIENARLYDAIQRQAAELEDRVKRRTAELEEALRVKAQFLANMSHELRTPLNFVIGFSELLRDGTAGPLTPKQAGYLDRIRTGGERLLELVMGLLELAEAQTGPSDFRLDHLALDEVLEEVLGTLTGMAQAKSVSLKTVPDPGLPAVVADRRKLSQILHHLVTNAIRYTPAGGRVVVSTRRLGTAKGEEAEIAVQDTGIGIRSGDLERIFRPFEQVDGSDTRQFGGAGLGLALVRRLVEQHGGRVWAESEGEGRGARFALRLPLLPAPPPPRILVVEDEESLREGLCAALNASRYRVDGAATGIEALERLAADPPDLLVLDIGLPDVDGRDILKRLRADARTQDLPILVLSGLDSIQLDQMLRLGADEFLTKPVSPQVLSATVARLLRRPAREIPGRGAEMGGAIPGT